MTTPATSWPGTRGVWTPRQESPLHYQQVVVAEAAGGHLNEGVKVAYGRVGVVSATVRRRVRAGLSQDDCLHGGLSGEGRFETCPYE